MSDSLSRLVEAVRSAGVDIAPGYCEYVRLAFAIANDCGEAGREGFIALCSLSVKFNREKAERLFSNSLKKGDHRIHLGTAFHLAELAGVRLEPPSRPRDTHASNASNANNAAPVSHTRACDNNVEIEIEGQVDPFTHLPFFPEGHEWPRMLRQIMAFGQSRETSSPACASRPGSHQTRRPAPTTSRTGSSPAGISPSKRMISKRSFPWPSLCTYTPYTYSRSFPPTR